MMMESFRACLAAMFWSLVLLIFIVFVSGLTARRHVICSSVMWQFVPRCSALCSGCGRWYSSHWFEYATGTTRFGALGFKVFKLVSRKGDWKVSVLTWSVLENLCCSLTLNFMLSHWSGPCDKCRRTHLSNRRKGKLIDLQQTSPARWCAEVMEHFGSVLKTMLSLYMAVTGGNDWSLYYSILGQLGSFYHFLFIAWLGGKRGCCWAAVPVRRHYIALEPHANDQP